MACLSATNLEGRNLHAVNSIHASAAKRRVVKTVLGIIDAKETTKTAIESIVMTAFNLRIMCLTIGHQKSICNAANAVALRFVISVGKTNAAGSTMNMSAKAV